MVYATGPAHAVQTKRRLSMNRPTLDPSQEGNSASVPDVDSPPPEGLGVGSWPQLTSGFWRCSLSMNRVGRDSVEPQFLSIGDHGSTESRPTVHGTTACQKTKGGFPGR